VSAAASGGGTKLEEKADGEFRRGQHRERGEGKGGRRPSRAAGRYNAAISPPGAQYMGVIGARKRHRVSQDLASPESFVTEGPF
jgi:hypothetical protein